MSIQAGDILINMKSIETLKGGWLIEVQSVSETEGSDCFLVKAILEQTVDEAGEFVRTRRIGMVLPDKLNTPAAMTPCWSRFADILRLTTRTGWLT